jgi:hypothetical protein
MLDSEGSALAPSTRAPMADPVEAMAVAARTAR